MCACVGEERDRDILEAREAGELGRRQGRELVAVQPEDLEAREAGELGRRQAREPVAEQQEVPVGHR